MDPFCLPVPEAELSPLALRAARGDRDLADDALQHLRVQYWHGQYDPGRGAFPAWASTVLRRYCFDAHRRLLRSGVASAANRPTPDRADPRADAPATDLGIDLAAPFGRDDLCTVREWRPRPRFVLLGWHGLWGKLPEPDRAGTLDAVRPAEPFPVPDFFSWPDADRTRYLARALRCRENTVDQIRRRGRGQLAGLRFVRELRGA